MNRRVSNTQPHKLRHAACDIPTHRAEAYVEYTKDWIYSRLDDEPRTGYVNLTIFFYYGGLYVYLQNFLGSRQGWSTERGQQTGKS